MKSKPSAVQVPDMVAVSAVAELEATDAKGVLAHVVELKLEDAEDFKHVGMCIAEVKARFAKADGLRRSWVDPLNGVVKSINAFFKPGLHALESAEILLKDKLLVYANEKAIERDVLLTKAGVAGRRGKEKESRILLAQAEECVIPRVEGLQFRSEWTGEVVDIAKLPREYMVPDMKALLAITKAKGGDPGIPGWIAHPKTTAAVSAAKEEE